MIRLYDSHRIRKQLELEGLWQFTAIDSFDVFPSVYKYSLPVPGCWESHPDFSRYRGKGVYRKIINVTEKSNLRLTFKGVSHTADVFFDGRKVAHHYNAYTAFTAIIPRVQCGEHELAVCVDNSFSEDSALHLPNDYYTYGGIIRPVVLETISDVFIEHVEFIPRIENGWKADIAVVIRNISDSRAEITVRGHLEDNRLGFAPVEVPAGEVVRVAGTFSFNKVFQWSNEDPRLYLLEFQLFQAGGGYPLDDLIERVGFRTVKTDGHRLLINGREVKLNGFNRHEDHAIVGAAIPLQLMVHDLDLIQDAGANCVRTSHYPNDERFLDLCDERGIYVWEENHARSLLLHQMQNPNFARQCENCTKEMVEDHINHPSIIIWGILNECASNTPEGRVYFETQFAQIKSMDASRPLTFASPHVLKDICLDLADIVSANLYPGWYNKESVGEFYTMFLKWVKESGGNDKPVIISEFGAAAIYGNRDRSGVKWSEEYQAELIDKSLEFYQKQKEICGTIIWQFCDCRVTEEGDWYMIRPRLHNNKGVLDEYRRPKLSYDVVRKHFRQK